MIITLLDIVHIFVCLFLMLVVLLQQGKGGGMGAAFGGGATAQVFGGRGAGNILTRATAICAGIFMLTSVSLAYFSSSGDRELRTRVIQEQRKGKGHEGTRVKAAKPSPAPAPNAPVAPVEGTPTAPVDKAPVESAPSAPAPGAPSSPPGPSN
jgi:preprotein translocase subunit SecG